MHSTKSPERYAWGSLGVMTTASPLLRVKRLKKKAKSRPISFLPYWSLRVRKRF
jgi:hypothetical protein